MGSAQPAMGESHVKRMLVPGVVGTAGLVGASLLTLAPAETAGAAETAIVRADSGIAWVSCEKFGFGGAGTDCGYLTVPRDWAKPGGTKIKLAISRVKATVAASKYQGVMLVNPGGPGGSGLQFSGLQGLLPNNSGNAYDWVGFDPRGVGDSQPAMSCIRDFASAQHPPYVPGKKSKKPRRSERSWLKLSKKYATACGEKYGDLLNHMHTTDWARDMDALRAALGANQINYLGFSYGTYLGQVYATMYPTHVRRMLLDGNVDPRGVWYQAQLSQDRAFERVANQFFAWVAKNNATYKLGSAAGEVRAKYLAVVKSLRTHRENGIGANEWTDTFVHAMYAESLWPDAAQAFAAWVRNHDMAPAEVAFKNSLDADDNVFAVYNAVQCTDTAWPQSYKTWRKDAFATAKQAPMLTWSNVWFNTACLYWPAKPARPVNVGGPVPMLLLNATLDGATPYSGAVEVRRRFSAARLVAEVGATTHAGSTLAGNPCIDKVVAAYLKTGALPTRKAGNDADVSCTRSPQPEPGLLPIDTAGVTLPDATSMANAPASLPAPDPGPHPDQSLFDKIVGLLPSRR